MKIVRLKTAVVEGNFDWTFVRIETDEGIRGLGECFFAPGLTSILRSLELLLIGEDPRDIHRLFRKLQMATSGAGSVAGIIYNAISGIEAALWDVLGQWLEAPIYRLLGGKFRNRIRIYADCHGGEALESLDEVLRSRAASWEANRSAHTTKDYFGEAAADLPSSPEDYRRRALAKRAEGFTALKFDLDVPGTEGPDAHNRVLSNRAIDHMVSLIAAVYDAVGRDTDIAVDCHWRYNASDVVKVARELEPFGLLWLEDPVPPNNTAALKEVSSKVRVPIATGENLFLFEGFQEIIGQHALSIVTPDLQKVGWIAKAGVLGKITAAGLIAVIRAESSDQAARIAEACALGGVAALEITYTVPGASGVIEHLTKNCSAEILLGAGTVLDPETARIAILAGAQFVVSPALNPETARLCNRYQVAYMPGAGTIGEVIEAMECGAEIVKVFPGEILGPAFVKAVKGPLPQAQLMPTGGVSLENVDEWIKAGAVAVGVGGNLTAGAKQGDFASITRIARQFVDKIKEARSR